MDSLIGQRIGNYDVASEIARRDTVQVYQGRHCIFTDRLVALKVFDVPPLSGQQHRSFADAARQLERLKHPQILPLIDAGIFEGKPYLVTAYAPNGSLHTYLSQLDHQPLPHQQAIRLLSQVGQALHAAHQQQIVHGNLKPENILFDAEHNACLTDFRLPVSPTSPLVHQDESVRSMAYVAPEQLQGEMFLQSDQYALGCLAYELLTGSPLLLDDGGATPKLPGGRTTSPSSISSQVHLPA